MYYESAPKIMSCSEKLGFIGQSDAFLAGLFFGFKFCWIHLTAIQALSSHKIKRNMEGGLKSFQLYGSCSWGDLLKSGFWWQFSQQNKPILACLTFFLKKTGSNASLVGAASCGVELP